MTWLTFVSATSLSKDTAFADTMLMDMQHDTGGSIPVLLEEALQNMNDELHRSVVVVQKKNTVQIRSFRLRLGAGDNRRAAVRSAVLPFAVALHVDRVNDHFSLFSKIKPASDEGCEQEFRLFLFRFQLVDFKPLALHCNH